MIFLFYLSSNIKYIYRYIYLSFNNANFILTYSCKSGSAKLARARFDFIFCVNLEPFIRDRGVFPD